MNRLKIIISLILMNLFLISCVYGQLVPEEMEQTDYTYQESLKESLRLDRQKTLNETLRFYQKIEDSYRPTSSGLLYAMIGDLYYQLEDPALAIFYYYRALRLDSTNTTIKNHLYLAQNRLDLPIGFEQSFEEYIFSFGNYLDQWQRWEMLFFLILVCLICGFLALYWSSKIWKVIALTNGILAGIMLVNLLLTIYFIPNEGILIEPAGLYRQPEKNQSQVTFNPLLKGVKVKIIGINSEADWLKIEDREGTVGYVPSKAIKLL